MFSFSRWRVNWNNLQVDGKCKLRGWRIGWREGGREGRKMVGEVWRNCNQILGASNALPFKPRVCNPFLMYSSISWFHSVFSQVAKTWLISSCRFFQTRCISLPRRAMENNARTSRNRLSKAAADDEWKLHGGEVDRWGVIKGRSVAISSRRISGRQPFIHRGHSLKSVGIASSPFRPSRYLAYQTEHIWPRNT